MSSFCFIKNSLIGSNLLIMSQSSFFDFRGRTLDLAYPQVMGILNVTPDSFSDGGELMNVDSVVSTVNLAKAMARAESMVKGGAAILDIGGESTRPGAEEVSSQQEIERVMPVVEKISRELDVIISVDTSNPELIGICGDYNVGLINDVRALERPGALEAAESTGIPVCLMHMQGDPQTMQDNPEYSNVVDEVSHYLSHRVQACIEAGIRKTQILLDPGFGFGKTLDHNIELIGRLGELLALELPMLVGVSRKRMIGTITGRREKDRIAGTIAATLLCVEQGARIVRTHDVHETVDALKVYSEVMKFKARSNHQGLLA